MPYYLNIDSTTRQIKSKPFSVEADATAALPASGQSTVTIADDDYNNLQEPNSIWYVSSSNVVQRGPAVIDLADYRAGWLRRLGDFYKVAMDNSKEWWPRKYGGSEITTRQRSEDVLNYEIPNWLFEIVRIVAAAIQGRAWTTMTHNDIEACVAHLETLLNAQLPAGSATIYGTTLTVPAANGIVERWYVAGVNLPSAGLTSTIPDSSPVRTGSGYARVNNSSAYTDAFEVSNSKLVKRTPDYAWNTISNPGTLQGLDAFDPENPS